MTQERKIALVTGASRGIGAAIAEKLIQDGFFVVGTATSESGAEKLTAQFGDNGAGRVLDVRDGAAIDALVTDIEQNFGSVLILVNNAGITKDGLIMRMSEEDFTNVVDVNLKGTFHCIRFASRQMMKQRSGRIINMSSVVGISGNAGQINYAASKAGVIGMTKSAAKELASRGITVNAIAPGYIETDMTNVLSDKVKEETMKQIPLGRLGQTGDIAAAAAFLASDEAGYITGQVLAVDGGMAI